MPEVTSEALPEEGPYKGSFRVQRRQASVTKVVTLIDVLYVPGSDEGLGVDPIPLLSEEVPLTDDPAFVDNLVSAATEKRTALLSSASKQRGEDDSLVAVLNESLK